MTTYEDVQRKVRERLLKELGERDGIQRTIEEPTKSDKPLIDIAVETDDMLELADIIGKGHSNGQKFFFPKAIMKTADDWPERMRKYIPAPQPGFVPNEDYCVSILSCISYNKVMRAVGDTGAGKDSTIYYLAGQLNWPVIREDGVVGKEAPDLVGYDVPDGAGGFTTVETLLTDFVKYGGLYISSEPNVMSAGAQMALQGLLEPERILKRIGSMKSDDAQRQANENFRIFFTTNTLGTGDDIDKFSAASEVQDQSTLNRVDIFEKVGYLKPEDEEQLVMNAFPVINNKLAKKMVQIGSLIRTSRDQGGEDSMTLAWSPRQLLVWAQAIQQYGEPVRGFKEVYFNSLNDSQKGTCIRFWEDTHFNEYKLR